MKLDRNQQAQIEFGVLIRHRNWIVAKIQTLGEKLTPTIPEVKGRKGFKKKRAGDGNTNSAKGLRQVLRQALGFGSADVTDLNHSDSVK